MYSLHAYCWQNGPGHLFHTSSYLTDHLEASQGQEIALWS